jgi:hypothetical protein
MFRIFENKEQSNFEVVCFKTQTSPGRRINTMTVATACTALNDKTIKIINVTVLAEEPAKLNESPATTTDTNNVAKDETKCEETKETIAAAATAEDAKANEEPIFDEANAEETKTETPNTEEDKAEESKIEAATSDEPKAEEETDTPKADTLITDNTGNIITADTSLTANIALAVDDGASEAVSNKRKPEKDKPEDGSPAKKEKTEIETSKQ